MQKNIYKLEKYLPMPSLQNITLLKIITTLCNNEQLLSLITGLEGDFRDRKYAKKGKEFQAIRSLANERISKICNCIKIKEMILDLLWPISYKIISWKSTYAPSVKPTILYWTFRGRIDSLTTGKCIIRNEKFSIRERFTLACILCLKKEIYKIWNKMTNDDRNYFQERNEECGPLLFWVYTMNGSNRASKLLREDLIKYSTKSGLLEAVKYFFTILPGDDLKDDIANLGEDGLNEKISTTCFIEEEDLDIGYLLYSKMSNDNKLVSFHFNSTLTLSLLFHSSEHKFSLHELAERLPFALTSDIESFLCVLFYSCHLEVMNDQDYYKLFSDAWRMVPTSVRSILKGEPYFGKHFLKVMIKSEYRHLLECVPTNIDQCVTSDSEPYSCVTPYCFEEKDWKILYFFTEEEIVTVPSLWKYRNILLDFLEEKNLLSLVEKSLKICT